MTEQATDHVGNFVARRAMKLGIVQAIHVRSFCEMAIAPVARGNVEGRAMKRATWQLLIGGSFLLNATCMASASDWHLTEGANCFGSTTLAAAVSAITGGGVPIHSGGGPGNFYVALKANELNAIRSAQERLENIKRLDGQSSKSLRNIFLNAAEDAKIPMWVNLGVGLATGLALPAKIGTATGLITTYLFAKADAETASTHDIGLLVAEGGEVYNREVILKRQSDENIFLFITSEYRVTIGAEKRSFAIHACVYPISVEVSEFETTGQFNNKIVKPVANNTWRTWDIEDNRFEGSPYAYIGQGNGYYYFERDQIENNAVVGKNLYRLSFMEGPFSTMDFNTRPNGPWKNFYLKVIAR